MKIAEKDPFRIIELLGLIKGKKIDPGKHLIVFDEVQECPEALNSLKYFYEKANEYHVISAGSLLGTLLAQPKSYRVGKENILNIYPLTFEEFLCAIDSSSYKQRSGVIPDLYKMCKVIIGNQTEWGYCIICFIVKAPYTYFEILSESCHKSF